VHDHDKNPDRHWRNHLINWFFWQETNAQSQKKFSGSENKLPPEKARLVAHPVLAIWTCVTVIFNVSSAVPEHDAVGNHVKAYVPNGRTQREGNEWMLVNICAAGDSWCWQHERRSVGNRAAGKYFNYANCERHKHEIVKSQNFVCVRVKWMYDFFSSHGADFLPQYLNRIPDKAKK
jgi:hypothetical protein